MKAIVVFESHWGNTAAIAMAIAEGIGPEAVALTTTDASGMALADVDLIVAGAPVLGFSLPTEDMLKGLGKEAVEPNLSHPSMRAWLASLPGGKGRSTAFETRIWWSPGGATKAILRELEKAGYPALVDAERFIVKDRYGPLKEGELERARLWGAELAKAMG
jgi:flavodoxin